MMAGDLPPEPMSELAAGAAQMHELFTAYIAAGFTESQALYLLGKLISASRDGDLP
jgi:hypothetical protein